VDPAIEWLKGGELVAEGGEAEKVSPSVEGDKVGADGEERGGEIKQKKEKRYFDGLVYRGSAQEVDESGHEESGEKGKGSGGKAGVGGHEKDDRPGVVQMKGERGQHHERSAAEAEKKPGEAGGCFEGGVGRTPVPGGESQETEGGGEGAGAPGQQVEKREG